MFLSLCVRSTPIKRTTFSCLQLAKAMTDTVLIIYPVHQALVSALNSLVRARWRRYAAA